MALRRFAAFDNEAFRVDATSPRLDPGTPIINNSATPNGTVFRFDGGFPYRSIEIDDTAGDRDVFDDDAPAGHVITDGQGLVVDGTRVESESLHFVRQLDDDGDPTGPIIRITVFSKGGATEDIWGMAANADLVPGARYVKLAGSNTGDSVYGNFVPCFTPGTQIATDRGLRPVESLRPGDRVMTRDNGLAPILWVGHRDVGPDLLASQPVFAPVRIAAGALGHGLPVRDMWLSPNHRVLKTGLSVATIAGEAEVLVAAKHLTNRPGIARRTQAVRYIHLLFEDHQIVLSDGAWTESFQPGSQSIRGLGAAQRGEVLALFPGLATAPESYRAARPVIRRHEARALA